MYGMIEGQLVKLADDLVNFRRQLEKKTYYVVNAYGVVAGRDLDRWDAERLCRKKKEEGDNSWEVVDGDEIRELLKD